MSHIMASQGAQCLIAETFPSMVGGDELHLMYIVNFYKATWAYSFS